jgi:hypothetical protein
LGWLATDGVKGRIRRIIIVAVARKLIVALWRYLETGLVPDGAELKVLIRRSEDHTSPDQDGR